MKWGNTKMMRMIEKDEFCTKECSAIRKLAIREQN